MTYENNRAPRASHIAHLAQAPLLERQIAYREHLVYQENLGLQGCGDRESQSHEHAARIALHRSIEEFFDLRKTHDLVHFLRNFSTSHAEDGAAQENIFAPGEFRMKSSSYFQETSNPPIEIDPPGRGVGDAG